ncbi:unnamed protein product [Lymnaea stagnalis]|uniref:Prokineticin domain-containing protein n=1 Tax=Lymnaea stagnalis TaxID=6523 RepID=A0AAV2IEY2_LYMST
MYKILLCCLAIIAGAHALVGKVCTTASECDDGECCQILSEFLVMSRRQVLALPTAAPKTGTCQKYKLEGDACSVFEKMNGHCSCEPGTTCHTYEIPLPTTNGARSMMMPRPGYQWISKCEKPVA